MIDARVIRPLPSCYGPLTPTWALPFALPDTEMASLTVHPERFHPDAFALCGISPTADIVQAVSKRQAEYLGGRLCAREALERLGSLQTLPSAEGRQGPSWPHGFCGSITHSKGLAAAVCGRTGRWQSLGLDVEQVLDSKRAEHLAKEILSAEEQQRFADLEPQLLVTLAFSLKEALYKALYPLCRRFFYFHHAELLHWEPSGQAQLRLRIDLAPEWPAGSQLAGQSAPFAKHWFSLVAIPTGSPHSNPE